MLKYATNVLRSVRNTLMITVGNVLKLAGNVLMNVVKCQHSIDLYGRAHGIPFNKLHTFLKRI
ncbi:MAG: hypothetical protein BGO34_00755 [Bacteroidia bacterium 44-10]|nr:MAG: hypothetical protein BGO34_00755 [Bacteroidia bacterium 44-10]